MNTTTHSNAMIPAYGMRLGDGLFARAFTFIAIAAPVLLVALAFAASPDSPVRVHIIVSGMERIVLGLAFAAIGRILYTLGAHAGVLLQDAQRHPGNVGMAA